MLKKPLHLTTPHMRGSDVKDAQYLLAGHNRFKQNFHPGAVDGDLGEATAGSIARAKDALGYPTPKTSTGRFDLHVFGNRLYSYLIPKGHEGWKRLPPLYQLRRVHRLRKVAKGTTAKARALQIALHEVGYHESGNNWTKFGTWYGLNGEPWCAIFVSYCLSHAGKAIKTAYAYQWEYWARSHEHGLSITNNPEPGDICVYHEGQGHTGFFYRWVDRRSGHFQACEGNEMNAVRVKDRWNQSSTVFVHVS